MNYKYFVPGSFLLPKDVDMSLWSVIACDQFTSDPGYWQQVESTVGSAPSTLRLMLPEAYLNRSDVSSLMSDISENMKRYIADGIFKSIDNSYIFVERTLSGGGVRRGLLGLLDLEFYDYDPDACLPVRATEGIVADRLPPRAGLREQAALELPHIILFIDDPDFSVVIPMQSEARETLYDFELMGGGGRVRGLRISGDGAHKVERALERLSHPDVLMRKYGTADKPVIFAVGDGNHSLATAKMCWEKISASLTARERLNHPARYALVELVNLHESAIVFEPIHRVLFDTDNAGFIKEAEEFFARFGSDGHSLTCYTDSGRVQCFTGALTIGQSIAACEDFIEGYAARHGGRIDYIHGDDAFLEMVSHPGCAGILMPVMDKSELFSSILKSGTFPKKSFSIGPALDKRYYLECREIM